MEKTKSCVMVTIFGMTMLFQLSFGLTPPYLISATALSDSSTSLTWRNNDAAATGVIIQRKKESDAGFQTIDSVLSATQVTYTDSLGLNPETVYSYVLRAYNQTGVSDTSNSLSATTLALAQVFIAPMATVSWDYDTSHFPVIYIQDSSNCESGYRISRDKGLTGTFDKNVYFPSTVPKNRDAFQFVDTGISENTWYAYTISAIKGDSSRWTSCTTFTFRSIRAKKAMIFEKIGTFPVSVDSGWSVKVGDSIIVKENPSPEGKFTVLNIADPANPKFDGYADSATLLAYPAETMIPVFVGYGVNNNFNAYSFVKADEKIIMIASDFLRRYRISDNHLDLIDSLHVDSIEGINGIDSSWARNFNGIGFINDSLFMATCQTRFGTNHFDYRHYVVIFNPRSFDLRPRSIVFTGSSSTLLSSNLSAILGIKDNQVILAAQTYEFLAPSKEETIVIDCSRDCSVRYPRRKPFSNANNLKSPLSTNDYLYTGNVSTPPSPFALYSAHPWDARGYETAAANNAVYIDSTHLQNALKNVIADTAQKLVYCIFNDALTVLKYDFGPDIGIRHPSQRSPLARNIGILPWRNGRGVAIVLPASSPGGTLEIFDVKGRLIDRMGFSRSNAVIWQPKKKSEGCFIAVVKTDNKRYSEKIILR